MGELPSGETLLVEGAQALGIALSAPQQQQLMWFTQELLHWNKRLNLVGQMSPDTLIIKHLLDSLAIHSVLPGNRWLDLGTGAGLPGIVLAIVFPNHAMTLVECRQKRCQFLLHVCHQLKLTQVEVINERVENVRLGEPIDCIMSRAVARAVQLIDWSQHLLAHDGCYCLMKGSALKEEMNDLSSTQWQARWQNINVPFLAAERRVLLVARTNSEE